MALLDKPIKLQLIKYHNKTTEEMLQLEEDLLFNSTNNQCMISSGHEDCIILGRNENIEETLNLEEKTPPSIIRRFSGGGTVYTDPNTLFISFIFNTQDLPFPAYPEKILQFFHSFYSNVFDPLPFNLKENDFTIKNKKCGGNAFYITQKRWIFHTSFLWHYKKENMSFLRFPKKVPKYRKNRSHDAFLCSLKSHFKEKEELCNKIQKNLEKQFIIESMNWNEIKSLISNQTDYKTKKIR
ncbi:MAG TPA: hypothetical protein P5048_04050 [Chlamydiales bacterium]|nr:hypothetical protein [Chlamydiales bacterium]